MRGFRGFAAMTVAVASVCTSLPAGAEDWTDRIHLSGYIQSDIRFQTEDWRGERPGEGYRFDMNRNDVDLRIKAQPFQKVVAVVDARLRFYGFNQAATLPELIGREKVDPFDLQLNEAYIHTKGLLWENLDLKIGRMIQSWGAADMFNPTDNLSSRDFSDPLDYTAKVPNQMVEIDLYPTDWLTMQFVWVPMFKPSQLPPSSVLGFAMTYNDAGEVTDFPAPPLNLEGQDKLQGLKDILGSATPAGAGNPLSAVNFLVPEVRVINPEFSMRNSQAAARAKFQLGPVDFSLSYYYGRFSFPVAYTAIADVASGAAVAKANKNPLFVTDKQTLDPKKYNVKYMAEVVYPRMQVAGFDINYSSENEWVPGFFGEVAVIFPEKIDFGIQAYLDGNQVLSHGNVNVPGTPFVKATAGLDWSYGDVFYVNVQYVRGFFDEFNDMYGIHNYIAPAVDLKFLDNELQIRLAGAVNLDDASWTATPQLTWIAMPGVELVAGWMGFMGPTKPSNPLDYAAKSKFGQRATGRNVAYFKGRVTF